MGKKSAIVWFRSDLRLTDNPALKAAVDAFDVLPVFIYDREAEGDWPFGAASRWWLHHSLARLKESLEEIGSTLIITEGKTVAILEELISQTSAKAIFFNKRYEPAARKIEVELGETLDELKVDCKAFDANLLFPPSSILTKEGNPYKVFTPFWRAFPEPAKPIRKPSAISTVSKLPASKALDSLKLLPTINWDEGIEAAWEPGEAGAQKQLRAFLKEGVAEYKFGRNRPDRVLVSRMSPYLHFGEISPKNLWHAVQQKIDSDGKAQGGGECYLRELAWREFAHNLLFSFPDTAEQPLRPEFKKFPWDSDDLLLKAWHRGNTGYPIVDAGMRELWTTGWMHNRVRMVVASFLVKDLLISWKEGAAWFWDTLVDADLSNNTLGWQWTAGCGADAAPYFRVFNPMTQGEKFDPDGNYVRKWVPELSKLRTKWIHKPWLAPSEELVAAGITLGKDYPAPIVDHAAARHRALDAFASIKTKQQASVK
ncbi:MAG: deoxyribodipyrimidine photo-lyase [Candidatus Melainabacteria bacterium]|nr:deoxyribodipyrimidine photo-lyase [Candidatus Melainabacteria bacterium]